VAAGILPAPREDVAALVQQSAPALYSPLTSWPRPGRGFGDTFSKAAIFLVNAVNFACVMLYSASASRFSDASDSILVQRATTEAAVPFARSVGAKSTAPNYFAGTRAALVGAYAEAKINGNTGALVGSYSSNYCF